MTQIQSNTARIHETSLPWRSVEAFLWHIPGFLFWFSKWQVRAMHGFNHFGYSTKSYSIWLVILMVYKPPLCMTCPSLFLTLLILSPNSPRQNIDVYLWPLVDDLKLLWEKGFTIGMLCLSKISKFGLFYYWTIGDFPTYNMLSRWSIHGKLACPYRMSHTVFSTIILKEGNVVRLSSSISNVF